MMYWVGVVARVHISPAYRTRVALVHYQLCPAFWERQPKVCHILVYQLAFYCALVRIRICRLSAEIVVNLQVPRTQTAGRGADAVAEAAWAFSLSTSAPSQQHAALPASDQQMASHASSQHLTLSGAASQAACGMQQDRDAMAGSQARQCGPSRFSLGASDAVQGGPELQAQHATDHSWSKLIPMGANSESAQHTPSHVRSEAPQSFPEGIPHSEGQTACLDGAAYNERSADRSFYVPSAAARAQPAHPPAIRTAQHGKQPHSQHAVSAAPANAMQHSKSRPQAWERSGRIRQDLVHLSAGHEQGIPGRLSTGAGIEANQMSQHSHSTHGAQQRGPSAASLCTSSVSTMAARPPEAVAGPQPRPLGSLGRPIQTPAWPCCMQPRNERQLPAAATEPRRQQLGSSGTGPALVSGSVDGVAGAAAAPGVNSQGRPGQQTMPMHAGAGVPGHAHGWPGALPPQQGSVPMSSVRTAQQPPQLHTQQQHPIGLNAHAAQRQTAQQSNSAARAGHLHQPITQSPGGATAPASSAGVANQIVSSRASNTAVASAAARPDQDAGIPGLLVLPEASGLGTHLAFMGKLPLSVMQSWVRIDVQAARAHLELTTEVGQPVLPPQT